MYLSRVEIDFANRKKIKDLSHLGAYHSWVEESFPWEISADVVGHDRPLLRKQAHVALNRTVFEGELRISNLEKFKRALVKGIGREKAFGMGLLTVIPVN